MSSCQISKAIQSLSNQHCSYYLPWSTSLMWGQELRGWTLCFQSKGDEYGSHITILAEQHCTKVYFQVSMNDYLPKHIHSMISAQIQSPLQKQTIAQCHYICNRQKFLRTKSYILCQESFMFWELVQEFKVTTSRSQISRKWARGSTD